MKIARSLAFMLTTISLLPGTVLPAAAPENEWKEFAEDVYYIGCYLDYRGHRGSVFVAPDCNRLVILDHELAERTGWGKPAPLAGNSDRLQGLAAGTPGQVRFFGAAAAGVDTESAPSPAEGSFLDFSSYSQTPDLMPIVQKTRNPMLLGLLAADANWQSQIYPKLLALKKSADIHQALSGMVMAGALPLAEQYLAANPPLRSDREAYEPDFRILLPWIREGLEATPAFAPNEADLRASPVLFLLPAVRVWIKTQSREQTTAAFYDTVFNAAAVPVFPQAAKDELAVGSPRLVQGPFERGRFLFDQVLKHRAPQLYQILAEAGRDLVFWEEAMVLDAVMNPDGAYLILWDPKRQERLALEYPGELPELLFGTRADALVRISRPTDFRRGQVVRCQFLDPDPEAMLEAMRQMSPGYRLGYVAKAVGNRQNELGWKDWREMLQKAGAEEGWHRINNAEVFQVIQETAVADELALSLPAMIRTLDYAAAGEQGLRIVAVYLRNGEYEKARGELSSLPEMLRACRETYDGKGDIGWANRCGIELMKLLQARLAKQRPPRATPELRQHRKYALDMVRNILVTVPGIPLEEWERQMRKALPPAK